MMELAAGLKAPDFEAKDQDGIEVSLSDFKGKKVVLYFYPRDMTPGCTAEACSLRDHYRALQKAGYEVLGISSDDEKSHRKFIEKEKLPFRLLADTDKSVHNKYGTWIEKSMYGRKYMGTARVTFIIDEKGKISEVIEKVDTKNHAEQILGGQASVKKSLPKAVKKVMAKPLKEAAKKKQ
jgi:thioredoxin-dependent peroxiredoxin